MTEKESDRKNSPPPNNEFHHGADDDLTFIASLFDRELLFMLAAAPATVCHRPSSSVCVCVWLVSRCRTGRKEIGRKMPPNERILNSATKSNHVALHTVTTIGEPACCFRLALVFAFDR